MKREEKRIFLDKNHPYYSMTSGGRTSEHRLIMAEQLGRPLTRKEVVHHIDNNALNNDPNNLQIMSYQEHLWITKRNRLMKRLIEIHTWKTQLEKELKTINKRIKELGFRYYI